MIVLGIDTSGYANAVGVADGEKVLADAIFEAHNNSLQKIVANIEQVLRSVGLALNDVKSIGVGLGPGSWTGIRVGVTVGKILAYSTGKPVAGIPTLDMLTHTARENGTPVCSVINAGARGAVYAAFYNINNGIASRYGEYYVGDVPGLAKLIGKNTIIASPEAGKFTGILRENISNDINLTEFEVLPRGAAAAVLAHRKMAGGVRDDTLSLTPLYLKEYTAKAFTNRYSGGNTITG